MIFAVVKTKLFAYLAVISWAGLIWFLSDQPYLGATENLSFGLYLLRKAAHVGEYLVLTLLLVRALKLTFAYGGKNLIFAAAGFVSLLFAASDEWHQTFVPGRSGQVRDVFIDLIGIVAAIIICHFYFERKRKTRL